MHSSTTTGSRITTQRNPSTDNVLRAHLFNNVMEKLHEPRHECARGATDMAPQNSTFVSVSYPHDDDTGTLVATCNDPSQHHRPARIHGDDVLGLRSGNVSIGFIRRPTTSRWSKRRAGRRREPGN